VHGMLFGMETELAFAEQPRARGAPLLDRNLLGELFALARQRLAWLPEDCDSGMFLSNGARFYLDRGEHPEICTPECRSPAELVRWQLGCERILGELVAELEKRNPELQVSLFRCNVDYSGSGHTWGCHESYQHRRTHAEMAPQLIPHLVSRLVYTGAGGFDNKKQRLDFQLSPRVPHLVQEMGGDTPERAIYNMRDEPLSKGGFNRLHVICGESLCSELANYLKLGATALVVRLVDAGVCRGSELALEDPLREMRRFARDPSCRARAKLADGRRLSAVEIQAEYLAMVEKQLGADFMPEWAEPLCLRWRLVLEQLASDPHSLATSLDWAIKHALFRDRVDRAGVKLSDLCRSTALGAELCEIDTRFGELSARALFNALDEAGVLAHRIPERGSLEEATREPPPGGRAEQRGRAILELQAERDRYSCRWDGISDRKRRRILLLEDPFATTAEWVEVPPRPTSSRLMELATPAQRRLHAGVSAYNAEDLPRAVATLAEAIREAAAAGDRDREAEASFWCSASHHDMGCLEAAESALAPVLQEWDEPVPAKTRVLAWGRQALILIERPAPLAKIERALEDAREATLGAPGGMGRSRVALLEARLLGARGRTSEAILAAERAYGGRSLDPIHFSEGTHLRWLVTFLLRAGRFRRALVHLDAWRALAWGGRLDSYLGASLAIAESALSLRLGRKAESLERATSALERSEHLPRHRCRLAACIAFLESAAAARELERCEGILAETHAWREVEIGELRFELRRAEALVEMARDAGDRSRTFTPRRSDELVEAARGEARCLDALLDCERHERELDEVIERVRSGWE
jgi:tetratricopeptide (TPR) repeat protein